MAEKICIAKECELSSLCKLKKEREGMHVRYFEPTRTGDACDSFINKFDGGYSLPEETDE